MELVLNLLLFSTIYDQQTIVLNRHAKQSSQLGCRSKRIGLNTSHFKQVENGSGQLGCEWVGPVPKFSHEKKNAKILMRINQINQGKELHLIPFVFFCFVLFFFFFLVKWAPTIIKLFVLLLYM